MGMFGSAQTAEPWHLVRKVFLLLLLVVALALGLVLLLDRGYPAPLLMFNLLADGSIGAAMGIGSRMSLRRRSWLIQAIVAASLSIVGLVLLGFLTAARSGVGPLALELRRVYWLDQAGIALRVPDLPGHSKTDLLDVAHMLIAINLSWIALRAWRGRPRLAPRQAEPLPQARSAAAITSTPAHVSVMHTAGSPVVRPITRSRPRAVVRGLRSGRAAASNAIAIRPKSASSRRRSPFRRRMAVQLAAYEAHKCPYCLQDIKRDDLRGSVECPICHTLHHKDCWDITGTCQVPHLNG
jgi:hypothetical protein